MYSTEAYACKALGSPFERMIIRRNECGVDDIEMDILYCGLCHTDVHYVKNQMGNTNYPLVPGHELAGVVTKVGENVEKFKIGDHVGVGCLVETCLNCAACKDEEEQLCEKGFTETYNTVPKYNMIKTNLGHTLGGYSRRTTVNEHFAIKIPQNYPLQCAGPIFCAGITMFSPLKQYGATVGGKRVGIAGIGGLGQMGIQLAAAMGNHVTAISTNPTKEENCKQLGAQKFLLVTDLEAMKEATKSFDLILNTISAPHQLSAYLPLLDRDGTLVQLGCVLEDHSLNQGILMFNRIKVAGSLIGGLKATQECMDLCAAKDIRPNVEIVGVEKIDEVVEILDKKNDTVKRYVLDINKPW